MGKIPSVRTSIELFVHHSDTPSVNSSLSAENRLRIPCNYGVKNIVSYLHKILVKSPSISTSYIMPICAPVHASSIQPVRASCIKSVNDPSLHHLYNPSLHHVLHLSSHPSMHHLFCPSILPMTNIMRSWMNFLVQSMGRKTHSKLQ